MSMRDTKRSARGLSGTTLSAVVLAVTLAGGAAAFAVDGRHLQGGRERRAERHRHDQGILGQGGVLRRKRRNAMRQGQRGW